MRAIVINRHGGPDVLEIAQIACPDPAPGEVLLRITAAAVNPADAKWRAGMFEAFIPVTFPHVLGYDVAGEVVSGEGIAPGTRMFGMLDPIRKGGYAEYVAAPRRYLTETPEGLADITAAALPTAGLTGMQLIERAADVRSGDTILITGALGAVGRFALHFAKLRGAHVIAAVRPAQREQVRALGADDIIALEDDWAGPKFDHVIDTIGGGAVARLCSHLKPGGKILTAATTPIPGDVLPATPEIFAVVPSACDCARLAAEVASGAMKVPIARTMPLVHAADAHRMIETGGQNGKIVLVPLP